MSPISAQIARALGLWLFKRKLFQTSQPSLSPLMLHWKIICYWFRQVFYPKTHWASTYRSILNYSLEISHTCLPWELLRSKSKLQWQCGWTFVACKRSFYNNIYTHKYLSFLQNVLMEIFDLITEMQFKLIHQILSLHPWFGDCK